MPLAGNIQPEQLDHEPYFDTLTDLDRWAAAPHKRLQGVLSYRARANSEEIPGNRGKLLVCHDYKGGYTESPFALAYTFNFWSICDSFVYFSHHRVTVPPPGWINAAHRQGVKMLGTLIFEGAGEQDCLRLLVGELPKSKTGHAKPPAISSIPLSPHYARLLADLAHQRGFDGYLLNVECPLRGGLEQTRAMAAWITLLQSELRAKVGPHAHTIWYDSVVFTGQLAWQNRLNTFNLPFFLPSTGIFTNYFWPPDFTTLTAQYFTSIDPALTGNAPNSGPVGQRKTLSDIYMGVDIWGRGSHGGGGFGAYKAIEHIAPDTLGLSVAVFGQAWTWESEQDQPGWTWESWWKYESKLWVGSADGVVDAAEDEPKCHHGPFVPMSTFFPRNPPPNPAVLAFHTTFCPGVGRAWFVDGVNVFQSKAGWTDVDKQGSVGDMVWPRPTLVWEDNEREDKLPDASTSFCMDDAWNGGNCLRLVVSDPGSDAEEACFRYMWLPVQSLAITAQKSYEATAVYKIEASGDVDVDLGLSVKLLPPAGRVEKMDELTCNIISNTELTKGWMKLSMQFILPSTSDTADPVLDSPAAIGLVIAIATETPTQPLHCSILLGQLNVFPTPFIPAPIPSPRVLWANLERRNSPNNVTCILTWEVAASFPPLSNVNISSPEDPIPVWTLDTTGEWLPSLLYSNIYVQTRSSDGSFAKPEDAVWVGTSGLDGKLNTFATTRQNLPVTAEEGAKGVRFYVQGVTDHGQVLSWDQCAYVETTI